MTRFVLSPRARNDLSAIWRYTSQRWDVAQADRYIRAIHAACQEIAAGTRTSRSIGDIRPSYRKPMTGSHLIIFRRGDDGTIDVVRVLHQHMDVGRHL